MRIITTIVTQCISAKLQSQRFLRNRILLLLTNAVITVKAVI